MIPPDTKTTKKKKAIDTGMALALLFLLLGYFNENSTFYLIAGATLIVAMTLPIILQPLAFVWFGIAKIMGAIMTRVLLSIVFFTIVTPIGLIRRLLGKDSLKLKSWKKGEQSVFFAREYVYKPEDLENLY